MKNSDFTIGYNAVWVLVIGNLLLITVGAFAKVQHWYFSQFLLTTGLILFFSAWIIILSDMVKSKLYNKVFWIIFMFIVPALTPLFYMFQRKRLKRLATRFG